MLQISGVAGNRWSAGFLGKRICELRPGWWNEAARESRRRYVPGRGKELGLSRLLN